MKDLIFITGNAGKAEELARILGQPIASQKVEAPEIQALDVAEVVEAKAKAAYAELQQPVLVEDTALTFQALGRLPGPFIKWFLKELGSEGICRLMKGVDDRAATAIAVFAVYDGSDVHLFDGSTEGAIAEAPRGNKGFGWDDIFIPNGSDQTWAEVDPAEKDQDSMRAKAVTKLKEWLGE